MTGKLLMGMISVIAVAAIAGIGFATYTSTASVTVTANAGSFYIQASGVLTASSLAVGTCTLSATGSAITLSANNMLPGDYCNWTATYTDQGSLPGSLVTWFGSGLSGSACGQFTLPNQWIIYPVATVSPGGTAASFWANYTDVGSGTVTGSCSGTNTITYQAA